MKITQIKIFELFGLIKNDFELPCNIKKDFIEHDLTIYHAYNGTGKTTLLRLTDAVLNVKLQVLDSIPFKKIELFLDDDSIISVEKDKEADKKKIYPVIYSVQKKDTADTKTYSLRYKNNVPKNKPTLSDFIEDDLKKLEALQQELNSKIITCTVFADDFRVENTVSKKSLEYNFFIDASPLMNKTEYVCEKIKELAKDKSNQSKINKFIDTININFGMEFKSIKQDEEDGLKVVPDKPYEKDFDKLPLDKLSYGEKNLIFMFYKLIFESHVPGKDSIILIDSPEQWFHISWQKKLLENAKELCANSQIIITTHSAAVVGKDFDLEYPMISGRYSSDEQ